MSKISKLSILIVDDDSQVRELLQTFFSMKSNEVICVMAADAQQAVLKMSNQVFDVILIDNVMPGRSGIDYALSLKKSIKYSRGPIIILMSGALQQEDVLKAMEGGLKNILVKPFSLKQLNDKIAACLKRGN